MGDQLRRLESDRALFDTNARRRLVETLEQANPHIVAGVIAKAIELHVVTEDYARSKGLELPPDELGVFARVNSADVARQVDKALTALICSIVSQEG